MRVVECDVCGETVTAADDEELARRLSDHLSEVHDETPSDDGTLEVSDASVRDAPDASPIPFDGPAFADVVAPSDACPEGELACGPSCVDTRKDPNHCGGCNKR